MKITGSGTQLIVDTDIIAGNYRNICASLPEGAEVMAVLKADAYGLGARETARALETAGCRCFAVTHAEEAQELIRAGVTGEILVTSPTDPEEAAALAAHENLLFAVTDPAEAEALSACAVRAGTSVRIHIKLDAGLSRLGFLIRGREDACLSDLRAVCSLPGLAPEGIFTHITAERGEAGDRRNRDELRRFYSLADAFNRERTAAGLAKLKRHALSTFPFVRYPEFAGEYVRAGALLFGASGDFAPAYGTIPIRNAIRYETRVVAGRTVPAGEAISYGPTYQTERETRTAVVPVGFADGYPRALSNRGCMLVRGKKAPVIGKVTCDYTILDVTEIPEVRTGDPVVIFGAFDPPQNGRADAEERGSGAAQSCGGQTPGPHYYAGEAAADAGMSVSELTSLIHPRVPRVYRTLRSAAGPSTS